MLIIDEKWRRGGHVDILNLDSVLLPSQKRVRVSTTVCRAVAQYGYFLFRLSKSNIYC